MKKIISFFFLFVFLFGCVERVPITGRKQISLIPESEMISMSLTEYGTFLKQNKTLDENDPRDQLIKRVGNKIKDAITQYLADHGNSKRIEGFVWEFHGVESETVNAWCMPGGKVVVYTGLLPITKDEASLAIVLGHEIGHAVARHGNERMSEQMIAQGLGTGLSIATMNKPAATRNLFLQAFGAGAGLELLSYSRKQESEADKLGLVFAAMAGYDPHIAVEFWKRMTTQSNGQKPPELLSTHPSDEQRIKDIEAFLPEAMKYYKKPG
ncbi:MAG TPA: M48 family metallopeptidase [Bacteroidia bacterium]|jgi:predicted Zn-dependent protease|nr:M48 family metallopeptidase [Bacteroidia bacterium]